MAANDDPWNVEWEAYLIKDPDYHSDRGRLDPSTKIIQFGNMICEYPFPPIEGTNYRWMTSEKEKALFAYARDVHILDPIRSTTKIGEIINYQVSEKSDFWKPFLWQVLGPLRSESGHSDAEARLSKKLPSHS